MRLGPVLGLDSIVGNTKDMQEALEQHSINEQMMKKRKKKKRRMMKRREKRR